MWTKFKIFFGKVGNFVMPFVKIFISSAGQIVGQVALDAVTQIAKDPGMLGSGGLAKRQAAFEKIKAELSAKGMVVATNVINAAIEAALIKIKEGE